jgi:hypothetical protein
VIVLANISSDHARIGGILGRATEIGDSHLFFDILAGII